MANYYGNGRSNYVHFTDIEKVRRIVAIYGCAIPKDEDDKGWAILAETEHGDVDGSKYIGQDDDEDIKELIELGFIKDASEITDDMFELPDFMKTLAPFIPDGEVLVWQHVGNEKLRYLQGYAVAINNKGEIKSLNIDNIYTMAEELGDPSKISRAEY
jgi:hypothetical protein